MPHSLETLGDAQQERLFALEETIDAGLRAFVRVGQALTEIRDDGLYRHGHDTFEAYCNERWEMSRAQAYRLIAAAEIADIVTSPNGETLPAPANEAQARALAPLKDEPERARAVWSEVVREHGDRGITADVVEAAVERARATEPEPEPEPETEPETAPEPQPRLAGGTAIRARLVEGDALDASAAIESGSVGLIVTEPPSWRYDQESYSKLWELSARVLRDGGSVVALITPEFLPEILDLMASFPALKYQWLLTLLDAEQERHTTHWDRHVNGGHLAALWACRGRYRGSWVVDTAREPNGLGQIIQTFTEAGDTVLDPFCGTATFGTKAVALGRRFYGIDNDPVELGKAMRAHPDAATQA